MISFCVNAQYVRDQSNRSVLRYVLIDREKCDETTLYHHNLFDDHNSVLDDYWLLDLLNYHESFFYSLMNERKLLYYY